MSTFNRLPLHILFSVIVLYSIATGVVRADYLTVTDDESVTHRFAKPFTRIISLYPAHTENLAFIGASESVIGISTSDTYPENILSKPRFSYRDNTEKILAASPDLILIRPMISRSHPELLKKLRQSGIAIVSLQPTSAESMFSYWQKLGTLTGNRENADRMVKAFKERLTIFEHKIPTDVAKRPRVYFASIHRKMKTFAPEAISIYALTHAGARNVAQDAIARNNSNIAPYGKERILSMGNEIDIFLSQVGRMNRISLSDIYGEPGFSLIKAVRTKSVYLIEEEIVSRPTMRLLEGIEKIRSILYPGTTS